MTTYGAFPGEQVMPKKILLISLYHPLLVRGGSQQACYELFRALQEESSCEPILLASVERALSPDLFKIGAHITGFDGRKNEFLFLSQGYDHEWHKNKQPVSLEKFQMFLRSVQPDAIHFHHFMTFGLEYLVAARRYLDTVGGQLVLTFHEFLAMCLAQGQMVRTFDKSLCEYPSSVRCHECFPDRPPEHFSMRTMWIKHHLGFVDTFVTPTEFLRQRYIKWGLPEDRIVCIPNGHRYSVEKKTWAAAANIDRPRNHFAFFGQLIDHKGLLVLFDAIKLLRDRGIDDFTVDVHGSNLQFASEKFRSAFNAFFKEESTRNDGSARVRFNGSYEMSDLERLMANVDWVLVPSTWWEIFGMVVSEAFLFGKPVICSNIGGIGERVRDNVDGLHFVVQNSRSLAEVMERAMSEEGLWDRLHRSILPPPTAAEVARLHLERCYNETSDSMSSAIEKNEHLPNAGKRIARRAVGV
jgi:glycosyltransferase involved in cell wall biosynthesis